MYKITILGPPRVKKNTQKIITRVNKRTGKRFSKAIPSDAYQKWHSKALEQLLPFNDKTIDFPVNMEAHFYMATNQTIDMSALYEGIQDVLVEVGVLKDDSALNDPILVGHDGSRVHLDRDNPRMEVTLTRMEAYSGEDNSSV